MKHKQRAEYFLLFIIMLSLFTGSIFLTNFFFKKELFAQQEDYLQKKAALLTEQLSLQLFTTAEISAEEQKFLSDFASQEHERITLLNASGTIIYDTSSEKIVEDSRENRPEIKAVLNGASYGSSVRQSATLKQELIYLAAPVIENEQRVGILRISEEASHFSGSLLSFRRFIILTFGLLFLVLTGFFLLLIRQKNKPLLTVLPVLKRMVKHPDENRSIIQDSSEWNELYKTVNQLSQQMSQTYLAYTSSEEQFQALINELMIGVFIINKDGKIALINPKMQEILGIQKEAVKQSYWDVFREPELIRLINQVIIEKKAGHQEIRFSTVEAEPILDITLRFTENPAREEQIFGIAYDLTRIHQLETIQKDFVGNVSHELKTPVTSLLGFTETLLDGAKNDPDTLQQFLEIMQKDALRLQQLIVEIIQLSRGEKNRTEDKQPVNVASLIQEIIISYQAAIKEKNLTLTIDCDKSLTYITSYELFVPILKNLIENAIQYSQSEGSIDIQVSMEKAFIFSIKDNSIGLTQEDQERIFERFYRVDKARSRHSGGTGLGLAIVQNYAELLHGTVTVESYPGLGSTFTVQLPKNDETFHK